MDVVSAPQSPRMPHGNIPYHHHAAVPRRHPSPIYPVATDRPISPRAPRPPPSPTSPRSPRSSRAPRTPSPRSPSPRSYASSPSPTKSWFSSPPSPSHDGANGFPNATDFTAILSKNGQLGQEGTESVPSAFRGRLPSEVFDCILDQLQLLHTAPYAEGCTTCYMRDLYSLTLTSRAWEKAARVKLYNKIVLHGNDSPAQLKKYKWKRGSRLRLLRRTLRGRKVLANLVLELRVPEFDVPLMPGKQQAVLQEYRGLIASVVMVCPNIERLLGISLPYTHEFDRLTHALSTRKYLKEHAWIIGENVDIAERLRQQSSTDSLDQCQIYQFLNYHVSWSRLETLMMHSLGSAGVLEHGVLLRMFNFLPSLLHLSVSGFHADDFTDRTLLFLPPLLSLRLEGLRGVTENGLAHYASRPEARKLTSLTLVEQNISSLLIISKILASLRCLEKFSICQTDTSPTLPEGGMFFQPLLASSSVKHLHWDVASPNPSSALSQLDSTSITGGPRNTSTPNAHLAQSILHDGFPFLRTLRAPNDIDPLGALQAVCRPARNAQMMIPPDRYSLPRSSHGSTSKRPLAMPGGNNLTSARIRAQTLIDMASKDTESGMKVLVTDHSDMLPNPSSTFSDSSSDQEVDDKYGILEPLKTTQQKTSSSAAKKPPVIKVHEFTFPSYMGRIRTGIATEQMAPSTPRFRLLPDIPGSDADGGLVSWSHFLSANQTNAYTPASPGPLPSAPGGRAYSGSSMADEAPPSPTTSRFNIWGSSSNASNNVPPGSPGRPPASPTRTMSSNAGEQPFWARDTCNGSWNQHHKLGKEWWMHPERERVGSRNSASMVTIDRLF